MSPRARRLRRDRRKERLDNVREAHDRAVGRVLRLRHRAARFYAKFDAGFDGRCLDIGDKARAKLPAAQLRAYDTAIEFLCRGGSVHFPTIGTPAELDIVSDAYRGVRGNGRARVARVLRLIERHAARNP